MRAAMSLLETMRRTGVRPNDRTYNTLMQGWIELKNIDRAMDLFKQMKRNKRVRPTIVTYTLLITGWSREMKRMDMAEKVMQELMNDRDVSPDDRTFFCSHHVQPHAEQSIRSGDFPLVLDVGFFRSFFVESVADVPPLLPARLDSLLDLLGRLSFPRSFECDFLWINDDHSISRDEISLINCAQFS